MKVISRQTLDKMYNEEKMPMELIAEKLHVTVGTIFNHMQRLNLPHRTMSEALKVAYLEGRKHPVILRGKNHWAYGKQVSIFTPTPSPALAYVLGVIEGDACVSRHSSRGWAITLVCKSKKFAIRFQNALKSLGLNAVLGKRKNYNSYGKSKFYHQVRACHTGFARWYKSSENFESVLNDPAEKIGFVKGFYDSEGCSDKKRRRVRMFNTQYKLLALVQRLLKDLEIKSSIYRSSDLPSGKTLYELGVYGVHSEHFSSLMEDVNFE